jgi:hypothetical protein
MRHLGRSALPATVLCALAAAGCSSGADSPDQGNNTTATNDPAFTVNKLRAIDPCGLLDHETLRPLGGPADSSSSEFVGRPEGFDDCEIDMKDFHRNDLSVRVTMTGSRSSLSGMPVLEQPITEECDEWIITPNPRIGILVDIHTEYAPCVTAREVATAMINHIRTNPPKRQISAGSLSMIDPCGTSTIPPRPPPADPRPRRPGRTSTTANGTAARSS